MCVLLKGIFFAGFSVQIVLGMGWMCANFIEVQQFGQPKGVLYPWLASSLGEAPWILYLLQLGLAGYAGYALLRPVLPDGRAWRVWYVLALLTVPVAMQCHLALRPSSFAGALFLLEFVCFRNAVWGKKEGGFRALAGAGCYWAVLALLLPEYGWLGLPLPVFTFLAVLLRLRGEVRRLVSGILLFAVLSCVAASCAVLTKKAEGSERTFWLSMASRMSWPTIWEDSAFWPQELLDGISQETVWATDSAPGNMERVLKPAVEGAFGKGKAQEYYRMMADVACRLRWPRIVRQIGWDALIYAMPLAVLQEQLKGVGYESCSGRNYEIMGISHPVLTKYYMSYGCWWFVTAFTGTAAFLILAAVSGRKPVQRKTWVLGMGFLVSAGVILVYYVMRGAGIADYMDTSALSVVWTAAALFCMGEKQWR